MNPDHANNLGKNLKVIRTDDNTVVSRLTVDGDLYILGTIYFRQCSLDATGAPFVYRDDSGNVCAVITSSGDLKIKGNVFIGRELFWYNTYTSSFVDGNYYGPDLMYTHGNYPGLIAADPSATPNPTPTPCPTP
jgi:hypothetical protein